MKSLHRSITCVLAVAATLTAGGMASAQTVVKETTTLGTITEFSPETIVVRTEAAPEPIRYHYSKTTTYVDESGAPVSIETVKSGLPVTVYYTKSGDRMVASKVIVRKKAAAPVETTTTTTTTIEKKKKKDD